MEWVSLDRYKGLYLFNSYGEVKCLPKKGNHYTESISRGSINLDGYYIMTMVNVDGIIKQEKIHRVIAEIFIPNPLDLPQVNHKNTIKTDNRVANLEWNTDLQNKKHAYENGLMKFGENFTPSVLTNVQALEIFNSPENQYDLAKKFSITQSTVSAIKTGKTWFHITGKNIPSVKKRLSKEDILIISKSIEYPETLADKYNVTKETIYNIRNGRSYSKTTGINHLDRVYTDETIVMEIFKSSLPIKELCRKFKFSESFIRGIKLGHRWSDITGLKYNKNKNEGII